MFFGLANKHFFFVISHDKEKFLPCINNLLHKNQVVRNRPKSKKLFFSFAMGKEPSLQQRI